jgi:hypothetical protein
MFFRHQSTGLRENVYRRTHWRAELYFRPEGHDAAGGAMRRAALTGLPPRRHCAAPAKQQGTTR